MVVIALFEEEGDVDSISYSATEELGATLAGETSLGDGS